MKRQDVVELVERAMSVAIAAADVDACTRVLHDMSRLIAWAEATKVDVARRLEVLASETATMSPEHVVATATRVSLGQAMKPFTRARTLDAMPAFAEVLGDGAVSVDHVDVVSAAVAKLDTGERQRFAERAHFLATVAQRSTPGDFARTVRAEALRCRQRDGLARLERQRRATFLKTWVDAASGMWCLYGEFDPETGMRLQNRLSRTTEMLFHTTVPATAPADPLAKQHHVRALALAACIEGDGAESAPADVTVLIDAATLVDGYHDKSVIDCGLPIDLPLETVRRMACTADITPIIVAADGVRLHLGRTTRLASTAQRRALRAMYRTCAVDGCSTAWDKLAIHHVHYFRNGGPTNIDNLVPLCTKHHHLAHEGQWRLTLRPDRTLCVELPDGTTMCHSPPRALAA